jgi:hypothetical protein
MNVSKKLNVTYYHYTFYHNPDHLHIMTIFSQLFFYMSGSYLFFSSPPTWELTQPVHPTLATSSNTSGTQLSHYSYQASFLYQIILYQKDHKHHLDGGESFYNVCLIRKNVSVAFLTNHYNSVQAARQTPTQLLILIFI